MAADCRTSLSDTCTALGKVLFPEGGKVGVNAFLGVPYAQPPVGELRFCPPKPAELWTGERDCRKFGAIPIQPVHLSKMMHYKLKYPETTSEDCLFLNIYTPNLSRQAKLPVMVWFYGGGYIAGASDPYEGTALAGFHDVIVVTVNYRLGALGFLTTADDVIPGNNGLLDQVEALRWLKLHVLSFGGNPDNVTIFGQSAGGMACSLHVLSDMTRGLFQRAIIQSGPATSPFAVTTPQRIRTRIQPTLDDMGYTGKSSEDLAAFLRSIPAEDTLKFDMIFKPVIDGRYLKDYPHNLYHSGQFQHVPIISGCCSHDGYVGVQYNLGRPDLPTTKPDLENYVTKSISNQFSENVDAILKEVYPRYIGDDAVGNVDTFHQQYTQMVGDMMYYGPNHRMTVQHCERAPVYVYMYSHRGDFVKNDPPWMLANHCHDMYATFGMTFTDAVDGLEQSDVDKDVCKTVMAYWTNFAKSGDPNGPGLASWSPFDSQNTAYLILQENPQLDTNYKPDLMEFWVKDIPKFDTGREYEELQ